MKKLRDIMRPDFLHTVSPQARVADAARLMADKNVGIVAVLDGDRLAGVFSERDLLKRVVARGLDPLRTPVGDVMTADIVAAGADEDYQSAMRKMDKKNIRHLPVVEGGRVLSMLSIRDLMRAALEDAGQEIESLQAYLYQTPPGVSTSRGAA
jgi:CBS domain-containing protein